MKILSNNVGKQVLFTLQCIMKCTFCHEKKLVFNVKELTKKKNKKIAIFYGKSVVK